MRTSSQFPQSISATSVVEMLQTTTNIDPSDGKLPSGQNSMASRGLASTGRTTLQKDYDYIIEDFDINEVIIMLNIHTYRAIRSSEKLDDYLVYQDPHLAWIMLKKLLNVVAAIKCENYLLYDYVEKNLPSSVFMSLNLELSMRKTATSYDTDTIVNMGSFTGSAPTPSLSAPSVRQPSIRSTLMRKRIEYSLNFKAKALMAEKLVSELEKRLANSQIALRNQVREIQAHMMTLNCTSTETQQLEQNFLLFFTRDLDDRRFLETAAERHLMRSFKKFTKAWQKAANHIIANIRITNNMASNRIASNRLDLLNKKEMKGILKAIDYERMLIQREELVRKLASTFRHTVGLKSLSGYSSQELNVQKRIMSVMEANAANMERRVREVYQMLNQVQIEFEHTQQTTELERERLRNMIATMSVYEAPSTSDYIEKKSDLANLVKEAKYLTRRLGLCRMKVLHRKS